MNECVSEDPTHLLSDKSGFHIFVGLNGDSVSGGPMWNVVQLQGETPKRGGGGVHFKRVKWIYGLHFFSPSDQEQPRLTNRCLSTYEREDGERGGWFVSLSTVHILNRLPSTSVNKHPGRPSLLSCRSSGGTVESTREA